MTFSILLLTWYVKGQIGEVPGQVQVTKGQIGEVERWTRMMGGRIEGMECGLAAQPEMQAMLEALGARPFGPPGCRAGRPA